MSEQSASFVPPQTPHRAPEGPSIRPGRYRHYKGPEYQIFGLVRHSETEEWLVHYRALYGEMGYWVRPYRMFIETIEVDGEPLPRFEYLGPIEPPQPPLDESLMVAQSAPTKGAARA